jgi:CheY-like chemotaxis protein
MLSRLTALHGQGVPIAGERAKVLIVDDERINRMVLGRILADQFSVVEAADGATAVELVGKGDVDLVVLDINMPGMDGYETTRRIKEVAADRFLPVVLMTASNEEGLFARGLVDGADDFIIKPVTRALIEGKIKALLRVSAVFRALLAQNAELNSWRARAERDFGVAQRLFEHIAERGRFDFPDLDIRGLSLEDFNGDIVLAAPLGGGRLRIMVGDFAGHGLGAALGALPVSDVFYAMTRRHFPIESVVREIGGKLFRLFPRNLFLAACVADIDTRAGTVRVWNGGLPAPLIIDVDGKVSGRAPSRHLALGVLSARDLVPHVTELAFPLGARFVVYSDGLIEARSPDGESFGEGRLEAQLAATANRDDWFAAVWSAFQGFRQGTTQDDDVTVVGLRHTEALRSALVPAAALHAGLGPESEISIRLRFDAASLREPDSLAPLRILFEASPGLAACATELYTIACELFSNAVDHGLLRLDSAIKANPGGFEEYYRRREAGLRDLTSGTVTVVFEVLPDPGRRFATIRVSDDGAGDSEQMLRTAPDLGARAGRGLQLITELGAELRIVDGGRSVEAVFPLSPD